MSREGRSRWDFGWRKSSHFMIGKQGNPMLHRGRLLQTPLFGLYVHFIYREDLDPVPHDHPWRFWSLILRGGYAEEYHDDVRLIGDFVWQDGVRNVREHGRQREHGRWSFHGFSLRSAHRITRVEPGTVTLVLVGRKVRSWGFYDGAGRFVDYRDALGLRPTEGIAEKRPVAAERVR